MMSFERSENTRRNGLAKENSIQLKKAESSRTERKTKKDHGTTTSDVETREKKERKKRKKKRGETPNKTQF
jgi:hypothetical protein